MVRALPLKFFEPLPSLEWGFTLNLEEGSDVIAKLGSFSRCEAFA